MLTTAQLQALKADILASPDLSAFLGDREKEFIISGLYNAVASPDYFIWNPAVPVDDITNAITWANFTPAAAVPTDAVLNVSIWQARSLACQGKQFNLQTLLQGRTTIDATKPNLRQGLSDALTGLPSGANGAVQGAGAAAVTLVLSRPATRVEKLFATGGGTKPSPSTPAFTGTVAPSDVLAALALPDAG